ncbi:transposase family protein [Streptomyces neyagawaensis]|uniref:transposase family protein n=1 Tax=Streptomyces neyagawaensis TaxID=42238 RepID=UPI003F4CD30C
MSKRADVQVLPAYLTSGGQAILAARPNAEIDALYEGHEEVDLPRLRRELGLIRRRGFAINDQRSKHRRQGVDVQVVTDPNGEVLWLSPALPGRCHDLIAARAHWISRICGRQWIPILADRAPSSVPARG